MSSPNSDKRPADELGGVDDVVSTTSKKPRSTLQPKLQRPSNDNVPVNVYMAGGTVFGINNGHYLLPAIQGQKIKDICWMMSSTATRDEFTGKEAYILFSNGKLVQWGKGQEQWHDVCHQHRKISKSPFLTSVAQVACGYHHAAAVKTDGSVWTWGYENQYGQLGREPAKATGTLFPPSKVDALGTSPIHQVACAVGATFALNECGQVFSWGSHHTGETGQGKDFGFDPEPKLIHLPPAKQISACCAHAGALTTDGKVYAWGMLLLNCSEDDGRTTGNDDYDDEEEEFEYITSPTLVEGGLQGKIVKQLDSGTSEMGALTVDGSCYMWGDGPVENGGYPGYKSGFQPASMTKWFPKDLSNCKIASIAIGGYHAVFLTTNGEVLVGGRNHWGQLGLGSEVDTFYCMTKLPPVFSGVVHKIVAKGNFTAILTKESFVSERKPTASSFCLQKLFNNPETFPDMEFTLADKDDEVICYAHKSILCQQTDYFRAMLQADMKETNQKKFPVHFSKEVFLKVMKFIYGLDLDDTGEVDPNVLPDLFDAAEFTNWKA